MNTLWNTGFSSPLKLTYSHFFFFFMLPPSLPYSWLPHFYSFTLTSPTPSVLFLSYSICPLPLCPPCPILWFFHLSVAALFPFPPSHCPPLHTLTNFFSSSQLSCPFSPHLTSSLPSISLSLSLSLAFVPLCTPPSPCLAPSFVRVRRRQL